MTKAKTYGEPFGYVPEDYPGWPPGTQPSDFIPEVVPGGARGRRPRCTRRPDDHRVDVERRRGDRRGRQPAPTTATPHARATRRRPPGAPRTPSSSGRIRERRRSARVLAPRRSAGSASRRSCRTSTSTPPAATSTSGPNCGSRTTPSAISTPGGAIGATTTSGRAGPRDPRTRSRSATASSRPRTTPPTSDLCCTPGAAVFTATGQPTPSAAAIASSDGRRRRRVGVAGTP